MPRSFYSYKYDKLISWGFLPFEAREFARQYSMRQIRTIPYLTSMTRWRRLYVSNQKSRGLSDDQIIANINNLYLSRGWIRNRVPDPWQLLKRFRKQTIQEDKYIPPKRKDHHPKGVSKGDIVAQRKRRKARTALQRYAEGRGRE